ncbi:hypothetical protein [Streptomyces pluripotens]|uniref:hypothetical protein n=1 Tax=Streptomyces pluripotens TaxID=1355015 RepID=UPI000A90064D|nr:hypothetical protein [Streptomyces pluripotens]
MKHDLIVPAIIAGAYAFGRIQQWTRNRSDRKTTKAIEHIRDVLNKSNDKKGKPE